MKLDTRTTKNAVYLIDEYFPQTNKHPVPSGWDKDRRGDKNPAYRGAGERLETRDDGKYPLILSRRFLPIRSGKASFHHIVEIESGDGFFLEFYSIAETSALCLTQSNGNLCIDGKALCPLQEPKIYSFGIAFDLDHSSALITVDGQPCATVELHAPDIARLKTGYKAGSVGCCTIRRTILTINYIVCDKDYVHSNTTMPYTWEDLCDEGCTAGIRYYEEGQEFYTYRLDAKGGKTAKVRRKFQKSSNKLCVELKYLTVSEKENVKFCLTSNENIALSLLDSGISLTTRQSETLRSHHPYVWQMLRIEADIQARKALVKLNGKKTRELTFENDTDFIDGLTIEYAPCSDGYMRFADVIVYEILPEPEDYPAAPVLPKKKPDIYTGINVCSLWRTGSHWGWDPISNFHENQTYLGTYDEGITEVADWEIKWMAEHGLDCEFYCWYANQNKAPMLNTRFSNALHDGHFHAKYGDKVKFALIWEAQNCVHPSSVEQFKKYYLPLWIDYYFSDDRYFSIDGVAIMAIFSVHYLIRDLGSVEAACECFALLREAVKKIGYRDLCVIANVLPTENFEKAGINASYTYSWGHFGYSADYNIARNKARISNNQSNIHVVPTLSVGYNDVPWRADRFPMMTTEDMEKTLNWIVNDALPTYQDKDEAWKRKLLMFSTWNEYGEGTYIFPANLNGFGYLNEIRKAVTENGDSFESERPTQNALDRLGYLHPRGRTLLYTPQLVPPAMPDKEVGEIAINSQADVDKWSADRVAVRFEDGMMKGISTAYGPKIELAVDIDASTVEALAIMMHSTEDCGDPSATPAHLAPFRVFFTTEEEPEYRETLELCKMPYLHNGAAILSGASIPAWKGNVTKIIITPVDTTGSFDLAYIKLLARDQQSVETYIDGQRYLSHYPSKYENGEWYVPFEAQRNFPLMANLYYEWDNDARTLMIECDGKISYWTENSDTVIIDSTPVKLHKPLAFFDNLPYLPMTQFLAATGYRFTASENRLDILTK